MDLYPIMQNIVNNYGYLGIFLVSFTEAFIQPIPPDIFIMGAPMFGLSPIYSAIVASIGTLSGGLFGYFLGDRLGHPAFSRLFGKKYLIKGEHFFDKYGFWGVFLAGITPIPYKIIAWLAGIFEMNKSLFGAGTFIGRFPRFLLVAYFGYELRNINFSSLWDMNIQLFYLINSHNNWILDKFNILLSQTTYIVIGILTLAMFVKYRDLGKRIIVGLGITFLIVFLLKFGINEPRPYLSLDGVHLLLNEGTEPSFPSNHTTMSFALSTMLFKYPNTKKIGIILFIWALLVGYSRIYTGVHYPFDVAFGAILGIACGWFVMNFENMKDYLFKIFK